MKGGKKKPKRRYTDDERATALAALAANGGNVSRTSREQGVPEVTLRQWSSGARHPEALQMSEGKKAPLADAFEAVAARCLKHVTDEKLAETGAVDLLKTAGIAVDKARLLRDQATEIVNSRGSLTHRIEQYTAAFISVASRTEGGEGVRADGAGQPLDA
jgi:transposase-like protein